LSKRAALEGRIFPITAYPVTDLAAFSSRVAPELVKALARQESELNPEAESHAGALGLMQVMPRTAAQVARELGIGFSQDRLTEDWQYNARIGTHYLEGLLDEFNGSIVLSAAGYNAGPHRARSWIESYGDPRRMSPDQVIDWIEGIPFRETRNYVQRVVEGLHVYRLRLTGSPIPIQTSADITRG
jgi:soluble lytic murein transglycosylase